MARNRRELSVLFRERLGLEHVYFQRPAPNMMQYPCVIYEINKRETRHANDHVYRDMNHYTVTLIGKEIDNDVLVDRMIEIPYCSQDRRFISDGLYHDVFDLYY